MSCLEDLKQKYKEYEDAMKSCLPKVDPKLVTELLHLMRKDEQPMYTLEVFLSSNKNMENIRETVESQTGEVATFYDNGTHMVAAHRISLKQLEEISKHDDVEEIRGTRIRRGSVSIGPSHERRIDDDED
jgi:thymidine phosphorylase